ncbi:hypothetical protein C8R45DRAFT_328650 [Mycena sanguinolenta]|nr:hypothetical protein C8R45DRAFT_328650 [Mycena sanguinolenta]
MRLVFATSATPEEPLYHPLSPRVEKRRSAPIERDIAHDPVSKPCSRRCFVCGTTGKHPLDFRICPRTFALLRRSLAKFDDAGRLVLIDGSPLPMTRHPGGVAAHLISRARNPTRFVAEPPPNPSHPPHIARVPLRPVSLEPRDDIPSPSREFNSSSPQALPPNELTVSAPERIPLRRTVSSFDSALSHARALFLTVLFTLLLDIDFRAQLRTILALLETLNTEDPPTFRQRMQPVFTRISHFSPT